MNTHRSPRFANSSLITHRSSLLTFLTLLILLFIISSCKHQYVSQTEDTINTDSIRKTCNAVYYWKTTFNLSAYERQWLTAQQVERLYIRYFDVYMDVDTENSPAPEATIRFRDSIPQHIEIVPTVFIDNELFKRCDMSAYAQRLVKRIMVMSETNDVGNIHEIQLDCDWTRSTASAWFGFLDDVKTELTEQNIILSITIRLHQLNMEIPPAADRGVLMCYNTGAVRSSDTRNSILTASDVSLYARNLKTYRLPLDIAYPTFTWAVWFSGGQFQALLRGADPANEHLTHLGGNKYAIHTGFYQEGKYLAAGDEIRFEFSDYDEIIRSKLLLEHQLNNFSVILYHLDETNLSKYTHHEISKIYHH